MGTRDSVANGTSDDLVARDADVRLKEGRKLVLCVRDAPFNRIHLENMLRAQQAGAVIMPAIPAFYHHPKTIDDLVTQYVCRVLAQIDLLQEKMFRWTGQAASKKAEAEFPHGRKIAHRARDGQVRALCLRAAVRADRRVAGGSRPAQNAEPP